MDIAVRLDETLFVAYALLNAVGHDRENGLHFGRARRAVRLGLASRSDHWTAVVGRTGLRDELLKAGGAPVLDRIPRLSSPPAFEAVDGPEFLTHWQRESGAALEGLGRLLVDFYRGEPVDSLWEACRPDYQEAVASCSAAVPVVVGAIAHLFPAAPGEDLRVEICPNLLDSRDRGYSVSDPARTWIFLGPSSGPAHAEDLIAHELTHRWVDPAVDRIAWRDSEESRELARRARAEFCLVANGYADLGILVSETIVRGLCLLLGRDLRRIAGEEIERALGFGEQLGFVGLGHCYEFFGRGLGSDLRALIPEAAEGVRERLAEHLSRTA